MAFDIVLVEYDHPAVNAFAILKDIAGRRPHIPVILVVEWDEKVAIPAFKLGAVDYVVKAADSFRALFFKLDRVPAASAPLEERAELNLEEVSGRERLERQLRDALATASDTQRSFNTAAEHFRQTQARLQATIDQERASREALEAKLAEADASRQDAQRLAVGMTTARSGPVRAPHGGRDRARRGGGSSCRARAESCRARRPSSSEPTQRRALEATAAAEQLAQVSAEFRVGLANAIRSRDDLTHQLREATAALEESRHHREKPNPQPPPSTSGGVKRKSLPPPQTPLLPARHSNSSSRRRPLRSSRPEERAAVERAALAQEAAARQSELEDAARRARRKPQCSRAGPGEGGDSAPARGATGGIRLADAEARFRESLAQHDAAIASADQRSHGARTEAGGTRGGARAGRGTAAIGSCGIG